MKSLRHVLVVLLLLSVMLASSSAFTQQQQRQHSSLKLPKPTVQKNSLPPHDKIQLQSSRNHEDQEKSTISKETPVLPPLLLLGAGALMLTPLEAQAAIGGVSESTLNSIGHYSGIVLAVGLLMFQRLSLRPFMPDYEEERIAIADKVYCLAGLLMIGSGWMDATMEGAKGWDFYMHNPLFWLKMFFFAILTSSSVFNSTSLFRRSAARSLGRDIYVAPMGEQLVQRMIKTCNVQLATFVIIPLVSAGMAHGEKFDIGVNWESEATAVLIVFFGIAVKNFWEAISFDENRQMESSLSRRQYNDARSTLPYRDNLMVDAPRPQSQGFFPQSRQNFFPQPSYGDTPLGYQERSNFDVRPDYERQERIRQPQRRRLAPQDMPRPNENGRINYRDLVQAYPESRSDQYIIDVDQYDNRNIGR